MLHDSPAVPHSSGLLHHPEYRLALSFVIRKKSMVYIPIGIVPQIFFYHPFQLKCLPFILLHNGILAKKPLLCFSAEVNSRLFIPTFFPCVVESRINAGYCIIAYINLFHSIFPPEPGIPSSSKRESCL